jgi:hypothetical protein
MPLMKMVCIGWQKWTTRQNLTCALLENGEKTLSNLRFMTEPDYKIEELFNTRILKVQFVIYARTYDSWTYAVDNRFDTLEEAKEVVRMLRKYKERVFHYVEEE